MSMATTISSERPPAFGDAAREWARIGILSFGGPTAQIALMHRVIVEERRWLTESQFLNALSFCMLLPGPEAMQLATYSGWKLHGLKGGLTAGLLFVLPGALIVLALSMIYAAFGKVPAVEAIFFGIKAAVLVIVIEALLRISKRALKYNAAWVIAGLSFIAIFAMGLPFPLIILLAALYGFLRRSEPADVDAASVQPPAITWRETLKAVAVWLALWATPLVALVLWFGHDHVLSQLAWFFSKLAVVTFGGAYAVLAYMAQDVSQHYGWLTAGEMLDGLGLAETTPGPLILVTQFVGYLAAFKHGGGPAILMGLAGALVALWATFVPCFLWIFAGAPYLEWIIAQPRLKGALSAIMAAVVGVILNLAVWFALHVFFARVETTAAGPFHLPVPDLATLDVPAAAIAVVAAVLLLVRHWPIAAVLAVAAALGLAVKLSGA